MEPTVIQLFRLDNGRFSWEVEFADEGLNQEGYCASYTEARRCIEATIENAAIVDVLPDGGSFEGACKLPPEGAVE